MIIDIDNLTITEEICGNTYRYSHDLNLNFASDRKRFQELKDESTTNNLLKRFGYKVYF